MKKKFFLPLLFLILTTSCQSSPGHGKPAGIINSHAHLQSPEVAPKFLEAMEKVGVRETVILGSPDSTFSLRNTGFEGYKQNNLDVLKIAGNYPGKFIPFVTLEVSDAQKIVRLKDYIAQGAKGLKLYNGNANFHSVKLNDQELMRLYAYCEQNQIPVLYHVNAGYYLEELEAVLKSFPKLKIICPHFCLSTIRYDRFDYLMQTYPQLYTDVSFGYLDLLSAALKRFDADPQRYRELILKYQDRIFFGTDSIVTDKWEDDAVFIASVAQVYRDVLETKEYEYFGLPNQKLKGFYLEKTVLEKIYYQNFERFMNGKA